MANFKLDDFESEYFTDHVPRATWFLFDSNNLIIDIPVSIYDLNYFIMQAASPRQRLEWAQKAGASFFFMREWSPGELIAG
ncbi:hypothetical protein GYMLUDRAFT_524652 [Collybiopsis luxurians FD-317 M1]|nr:hypothetical protein GYMLUDRAFT_524652 [Collybiopsis luxurians FD-317 M1]